GTEVRHFALMLFFVLLPEVVFLFMKVGALPQDEEQRSVQQNTLEKWGYSPDEFGQFVFLFRKRQTEGKEYTDHHHESEIT
ncbi:hypothetical protein FSI61_023950, partial [Escherichia coli]|nr:hypothetical protein [Escherichia coli]